MPLPSFLTIEGNIGAGKTTLARMLARDYDCRLILEEFSDNPFLSLFYEDAGRYGFPVELFFMAERHKQLENELSDRELFEQGTISDYLFVKTLLFARNSLNDQEFRLFRRLFQTLNGQFPQPDLIVFLHRPVAILQKNIAVRGRPYESEISDDYLHSVQKAYLEYFHTQREVPVLILHIGSADFTKDTSVYQQITDLILKSYPIGVHDRLLG